MNALLIDAINEISPYEVQKISEMRYSFQTDYDVSYIVGFDKDESVWEDIAYQLYVLNVNRHASPNDLKVRDTIICIVKVFFRQNISVLSYICETGDEKQSARNRLFVRWVSKSFSTGDYYFKSAMVVAEGIENYVAILVERNNPDIEIIAKDFDEFVSQMRDKPE